MITIANSANPTHHNHSTYHQTMTLLKPIGNNVLIQLDARIAQSTGGIAIPNSAQKAEEWGTVAGVGKKAEALAVGDRAFVSRFLGTHYVEGGLEFIIISEDKIVAKIEP